MALIEHLENTGWEEFLRDCFRYALEVLKNDRFRSVGSSVDDLRSWLLRAGLPGFASTSTGRWRCAGSPDPGERPSPTALSSWCVKTGARSWT